MGMGRTGQHSEVSPAAAERAALCDLFVEVGESAPTLCAGWDAGDLLTHLLIRETRPDAFAGVLIPPLGGYTARVQQALRDSQPFGALVGKLRSGPPVWSPLGLPVVRDRANLHEFFIHHEDVRRAQPGWSVRDLPPETRDEIWRIVRLMAPLLVRGVKDTRITLQTPDGGERALGRQDSAHDVTVTGEPGEILLYLSGRRAFAEVKITGSPAGQARLAAAKLGM
jgi:uncharacterized protein (TIGR03085 family)